MNAKFVKISQIEKHPIKDTMKWDYENKKWLLSSYLRI